jgi:hypothetical protein
MIQKPSMTKDKKRPIPVIIKILCVLILALIGWESFTYVSPVKGRVVEAETGKPMKGTNVRAGWVTGYANPAGGSFRTFKVYATKTDENGEFVLPRMIKLKIPVIERYQGVDMLFYEHGYVSQYIERRAWRESGKIEHHEIILKRIENDEQFNENLRRVRLFLFVDLSSEAYQANDLRFILDDFKLFLKKYPNSPLLEENYYKLAGFYETKLKDYKSALKLNEEFVKRFPNSPVLNSIKKDIERLKTLLQKSPSEGVKP